MNKKSILTKLILISIIIGMISCQTPTNVSLPLGVDLNTVQLGKLEKSGLFILNNDKIFTSQDSIIVKVKANGLTIKEAKIKANIDFFLKKDDTILATQTNILGIDGFSETISGVSPTYIGSSGQADLMLTIIPPSETKGELVANITLKDLNASGKLVTFETRFIVK
jgi:hypothetical protein